MNIVKPRTGIVGYGTYVPKQRKTAEEIAQRRGDDALIATSLGVKQKSIPSADEDTVTIAVEASLRAFSRFSIQKEKIGALFIGSESHPYAVKPSGTVVASALGLSEQLAMADLQFACKAGMQSLLVASAYVGSGMCELGMGIGADTAQARDGDILEYTAGAGGGCVVIGNCDQHECIAEILGSASIATDTPDFWRRPSFDHPSHAGRFTGTPAYFAHISKSVDVLLNKLDMKINEFALCGFHTPNAKFPAQIAKQLGVSKKQMLWSLPVLDVGNTYAGAIFLVLESIVDHAHAGDLALLASYGSGAGSDAIALRILKDGKDAQ
ncbi:MAG: hypothetical protein UX04_C0009G0011 [Microgenomates group bacterium GW2011_GWF2_45_18]|nr:MAG: hypothetical protein UW18_C0010G0011 [Microgenomates group bacterium GW2011_GWF1_44_10]KKU01376.1 MAG: hypothetical protein UX04_C0009G0011 [Microgenomates group bacterium GW2011_GWF2_45_18]OGJ41360.1 MAG: hypothetical protein A2378_03655 [Candidatus Pacebacteria bacterium RIFOXYB1_FULL_44_10]HAU98615.1 hydroxymethylglutaryl-CoA synthase [Candidatus Paceibacterota bacterium]HAX01215.1 hydroxymethylglutaryl-CoA synthase [Candidatus Paceibacterota bacterium]